MHWSLSNVSSRSRRGLTAPELVLFAVCCLAAPGGVAAGTGGPTLSQRFQDLVERINAARADLRTLEADFRQRKESELLIEPEVSRGTFSYQAPDRVRWDFSEPDDTVVLVRDQQMITWYRDLGRADRVDIGRRGDRVLELLGPSSSLEALQRYFTLSVTFPEADGAPYRLDLDPSFKRIEKRIRSMTLHVDPGLLVPIYVRYSEAAGETTELFFENVRLNEELPPDRFELDLTGVEVDR